MQAQILSIITPAMAAVFTVVFAVLWWRDRKQMHVFGYTIGFASLAVSFLFSGHLFDPASTVDWVIIHAVSAAGVIAIIWGSALRIDEKIPMMACVVVSAGGIFFIVKGSLMGNPTVMVFAQNGSSALLFSIGALTLWQGQSRELLDRAVIWMMAALATHAFTRPLFGLLAEGELGGLVYGSSVFKAINVVLIALLSMLLALVLLAIVVSDQLKEQRDESSTDLLSGLLMRQAFEAKAMEMASKAKRENEPVSLIVIDIDHFKRINDTFGHTTGDRVISNFGELIRKSIRVRDIAGRIGGEEVCIMLWRCDHADTLELAERIRLRVPNTVKGLGNGKMHCSASFGVAEWRPNESYASAFERADTALYEAKNSGRNQVIGESGQSGSLLSNVVPLPATA